MKKAVAIISRFLRAKGQMLALFRQAWVILKEIWKGDPEYAPK
jgi:hypothetical protein